MKKKLKRKLMRFLVVIAYVITIINGFIELIDKLFN